MVDKYHIDFHLTRGPAQLPRLFTLPLNEYSSQTQLFTVGRAVRCNVILDPLLVFASNVQCSICCVPRQSHTTPAHRNDAIHNNYSVTKESISDKSANAHSEHKSSGNEMNDMTLEKSAKPSPEFPFQVYLTDMCSSNGTFVNNTRISTSEPTLLHNDDCVIFGGLRDVDIGEKLPDDAFDVCDELIVWKVNMCEEYNQDSHCTSTTAAVVDAAVIDEVGNNTPNRKHIATFDKNVISVNDIDVIETKSTILPSAERLEKEERALLEMVQQTLLLKRSAYKTSPAEDLQVINSADSKNVLEKEELQSLELSSSLSTTLKKHNTGNASTNTTSNVANEYSPMVKQQLFASDTPLRTDAENLVSRKIVSECKKNCKNNNSNNNNNSVHVPLHEATANIMQPPSSSIIATTLVNVQIQQQLEQTGMKYTTGKQSRKAGLLLSLSSSSSSPHNVELPPPPLPFSAVRVGKFTFNAEQNSVVDHNKSEQRMNCRSKENSKNKSLKRVRSSEEELMELSCAEPTTQNTTKEQSLETCTMQEAILESQDMNTEDIHNDNRNVNVTNSNNSLPEREEQIVRNKDELYTLSFTSTHWKWRMGNVAGDSTATINVLLPITSIATLLVCCGDKYCEEDEGSSSINTNNACENVEKNSKSAGSRNDSRYTNLNSTHYAGIAVELKDYCQVPLLPKELTQGAKENRWIAWKLKIEPWSTEMSELPQRAETGDHDTQSNVLEDNASTNLLLPSRLSPTHQKASDHSESSTSTKNQHERNETNNNKNHASNNYECSIPNESEFINVNTKHDEDKVEHSDNNNHWVTVLQKFYAVHNLPQPLYVSVDTFEKVFDPSCLTKADNS